MIYISKGIIPWKPSEGSVSVSHCGALYKLAGVQADLWLAGKYEPRHTRNPEENAALEQLAALGIAECGDGSENAAVFRLLTNSAICPVRAKTLPTLLNQDERRLWRWIRNAGLRLTMAELTLLTERGIKPEAALMGEQNRQALTESIYTTETIFDGILENLMEKSPARDGTVRAVLGLLRKKKIFLI
jgi:hypothetical protein